MPEIKTTTVSVNWTTTQALAVALISLVLGLAGGWFIRKSVVSAPATTAVTSPADKNSASSTSSVKAQTVVIVAGGQALRIGGTVLGYRGNGEFGPSGDVGDTVWIFRDFVGIDMGKVQTTDHSRPTEGRAYLKTDAGLMPLRDVDLTLTNEQLASQFGIPFPFPDEVTKAASDVRKMADTQAAPLLDRLKSDPNNPDLLARIGNIYYDVKQYPEAIAYYERSLKLQPANAAVRTDMATAYWYSGNADTALAEFNKALTYEPNKANTLFNIGIVKWQSKNDAAGAIAVWQKLLDTNPNYEARDKVQQMIDQAKSGSHAPVSK